MLVRVISVNGQSINITDGKTNMTVSRQQLDETIKAGKIQIDNLVVKCINKQRDNKNKIISYIVSDRNEQNNNNVYGYQICNYKYIGLGFDTNSNTIGFIIERSIDSGSNYEDHYSKSSTSIKLIPINKLN